MVDTITDCVQTTSKILVDTFVTNNELASKINMLADAQVEYLKSLAESASNASEKLFQTINMFNTQKGQ